MESQTLLPNIVERDPEREQNWKVTEQHGTVTDKNVTVSSEQECNVYSHPERLLERRLDTLTVHVPDVLQGCTAWCTQGMVRD